MSKNNYFYLSLGHRCYTAIYLIQRGLRTVAYPFDFTISQFDGIIDCFENDFANFFPKEIKKTVIKTKKGEESMYAGKYFNFSHHDMDNPEVINKFKERIQRLDNRLKDCEINGVKTIFIRTVLESDDYLKADRFVSAIQNKYPRLDFINIFINDNKHQRNKIFRVNDKVMFAHSNSKDNQRNENVINFTESTDNNIFDPEVWANLPLLPRRVDTGNDEFKGWAIKGGVYPFDPDN